MSTRTNLTPQLAQTIQERADQALATGALTPAQHRELTDGHITRQDFYTACDVKHNADLAHKNSRTGQAGTSPSESERLGQAADAAHLLWMAVSAVDTRSAPEKALDAVGRFCEDTYTSAAIMLGKAEMRWEFFKLEAAQAFERITR